nr:hypothetical protein FVER53263_20659 [Fusarium verticillioides]
MALGLCYQRLVESGLTAIVIDEIRSTKQSIAPEAKTEDYEFEVNKSHSVSININEGIRKLAASKSLLGPIQLLCLLFGLAVQSISQELHIKILLDSNKPNLYIVYNVPPQRPLNCPRVADFHRFDTTRQVLT